MLMAQPRSPRPIAPSSPTAPPPPHLGKDHSLFGIDPLFWIHCKLSVDDVLTLRSHASIPDIYLLGCHPLRKVEITGIIVGKEESSLLIRYSVDDGTGIIPCVHWFPPEERYVSSRKTLPLGQLVQVAGRVSEFRAQRQITVDAIAAERNPNVETLRWLEVAELKETLYNVVPEETDTAREACLRAWLDSDSSARQDAAAPSVDLHAEYQAIVSKIVDDDADPTEDDLKRLVKLYVQSNLLHHIPFSELRNHDQVVAMVRRVLQCQSGVLVPSHQRISSTLSRAITALVRDGFMYHQDGDEDIYEVIQHELNIGPAILTLIQHETASKDGISEEGIIFTLRSLARFKYVTRLSVESSIGKLIADSHIYEVESKQYKSIE
ncbi:hypothetical protein DFJ77DRAFT_543977 [Powellomyces hirtus]|nr:hypothetical protein DFJ77DRAFT_543977 [Powellomyces hirtus]